MIFEIYMQNFIHSTISVNRKDSFKNLEQIKISRLNWLSETVKMETSFPGPNYSLGISSKFSTAFNSKKRANALLPEFAQTEELRSGVHFQFVVDLKLMMFGLQHFLFMISLSSKLGCRFQFHCISVYLYLNWGLIKQPSPSK